MTNVGAHPLPAASDGGGRRPRACRVLVVDDHADTADLTARVLRGRGYAVRTASDYPAGLAAARAEPADVLVCDLGLPGGDGCDLLVAVRDLWPAVAAVAVTGYPDDPHRRRCREAGFARFLLKPVGLDELAAAVDAAAAGLPCGVA